MKEKKLCMELILFVSIILIGLFFVTAIYISKSNFKYVENRPSVTSSLDFQLDEADIKPNSIRFSGWILEKGEFIDTYDVRILLYSEKHSGGWEIPCKIKYLPDLSEKVPDGTNYERNGFYANIRFDSFLRNKIKLDGLYDVYLHYRCNGKDLYTLCLENKNAD